MAGRRSKSRGVVVFLRDIAIIFVAAVLISVGIKAFLVRSFFIPSGSMMNTLQIDDRVIVNELVPDVVGLERGDVIVFEDPGGWLKPLPGAPKNPVTAGIDWFLTLVGASASHSGNHLIKRVIGLPGDTVTCCNPLGQMEINGVPLDEPYVFTSNGSTAASEITFSEKVPPASLWVMGDHRDNSEDSRYHSTTPSGGFVPIEDVVGRAFVITWPVDRWTWIDNYNDTFQQ